MTDLDVLLMLVREALSQKMGKTLETKEKIFTSYKILEMADPFGNHGHLEVGLEPTEDTAIIRTEVMDTYITDMDVHIMLVREALCQKMEKTSKTKKKIYPSYKLLEVANHL